MQVLAHAVLIFLAVLAVIPFVLLIICSFTDEKYAIANGFSFFPKELSLDAYEYLVQEWGQIGRAYLMSLIVMAAGTVIGVAGSTMMAYGLSRDILGKKILNF